MWQPHISFPADHYVGNWYNDQHWGIRLEPPSRHPGQSGVVENRRPSAAICVNFSHDVPMDVQYENTATLDMPAPCLVWILGSGQ